MKYKTILHGTCLLKGKHSNPDIAKECPVLRRQARQRAQEALQGPQLDFPVSDQGKSNRGGPRPGSGRPRKRARQA